MYGAARSQAGNSKWRQIRARHSCARAALLPAGHWAESAKAEHRPIGRPGLRTAQRPLSNPCADTTQCPVTPARNELLNCSLGIRSRVPGDCGLGVLRIELSSWSCIAGAEAEASGISSGTVIASAAAAVGCPVWIEWLATVS